MAYPIEPATLDPFAWAGASTATRDLVALVMPKLWRSGPDGEPVASLAAGEPIVVPADAPTSVVVTLRDDAVWSDGRPIVVEDLRFTWRVALDASHETPARDGYDRIRAIVAESPKRARIEFARPYAAWRDLFSAGMGVLPAHALAERGAAALRRAWPVSGGAFVLRSWTAGLEMVFERNDRAWETEPYLDRLRVVFVDDSITAITLLERGEVDVLGPYLTADLGRRAAAVAGVRVVSDTGPTWTALVMNGTRGALREAVVRRALASSIDRDLIERGLVRDGGEPLSSALPALAEAGAPFGPRNLSGARASLAEAGWRGSPVRRRGNMTLAMPLATSRGDELGSLVARAIQEQASDAGFELRAVVLEPERFWAALAGGSSRLSIVTMTDPPRGGLRSFLGRIGGTPSWTRIRDARIEEAMARVHAGDAAAAKEAGLRAASLSAVIPLYRVTVTLAAAARARGVAADAGADGALAGAWAWWRAP